MPDEAPAFDMRAYMERKRAGLEEAARYREELRREHPLREVLFEMTDACNLSCLHCGSACQAKGEYIDVDAAVSVVAEIARAYGARSTRISMTGGEPLLHPGFFEFAGRVGAMGFRMGMTTNATLVTPDTARMLVESGVRDITVSIDGLEESHDAFRARPGSWARAMAGVDNLFAAGSDVSVTTVAHMGNIDELGEIRDMLHGIGVSLWRITAVDPIGRAKDNPQVLLDARSTIKMYEFIEKARAGILGEGPDTMTSCAHYLGELHELEARPWFFSCRSGLTTASVTARGEFVGCLDVQRLPELVMGHMGEDSFIDAWESGYAPYRRSRAVDGTPCTGCRHARYCDGDSMHTWDFRQNRPMFCIGG